MFASSFWLLIRTHNRARCQAEIPLIAPSEIVEPSLFAAELRELRQKRRTTLRAASCNGRLNDNAQWLARIYEATGEQTFADALRLAGAYGLDGKRGNGTNSIGVVEREVSYTNNLYREMIDAEITSQQASGATKSLTRACQVVAAAMGVPAESGKRAAANRTKKEDTDSKKKAASGPMRATRQPADAHTDSAGDLAIEAPAKSLERWYRGASNTPLGKHRSDGNTGRTIKVARLGGLGDMHRGADGKMKATLIIEAMQVVPDNRHWRKAIAEGLIIRLPY